MNRAPVILPLNLARCPATRTQPCAVSGGCARALVDSAGRMVQDYSTEPRGVYGACTYFLDAGIFRKPATAAEPKVHDAPAGIPRG